MIDDEDYEEVNLFPREMENCCVMFNGAVVSVLPPSELTPRLEFIPHPNGRGSIELFDDHGKKVLEFRLSSSAWEHFAKMLK